MKTENNDKQSNGKSSNNKFFDSKNNKKPNHRSRVHSFVTCLTARAVGFFKFVLGSINRSRTVGFVPKTNNQELISEKNKIFRHLFKYKLFYLILILLTVLFIPLCSNFIQDKPLIMGSESYYHLNLAGKMGWNDYYDYSHYPLKGIEQFVPEEIWFLVPILYALSSLLMFIIIAKRKEISEKLVFFFLLLAIISPTIIWTFITISAYSTYLFFALLGFLLLTSNKKVIRYCSLLPFTLAIGFELFSACILLVFLIICIYYPKYVPKTGDNKMEDNKTKDQETIKNVFGITLLLTIFNGLILKVPLFIGPFYAQNQFADLISDLGGISGISFFTFILAVIGLSTAWKKKNSYLAYLLLPMLIIAYGYNTQTVFYLSLLLVFFAAEGFLNLFEPPWNLVIIKKFTLLLLGLGLLFSALTYLDRVNSNLPSKGDVDTLIWIKNNLPANEIIFSFPENGDLISYFTLQKPFYSFKDLKDKVKTEQVQQIISSLYIDELFPVLEQNNVSVIYVNALMKANLPEDRGLLFLLKNERFKIVYSSEDSEVWVFTKKD